MPAYQIAKQRATQYGQEHLFRYYDELTQTQQDALIEAVMGVDFEQIKGLYQLAKKGEVSGEGVITPISVIEKQAVSEEVLKAWEDYGTKIMQEGRFAAVTMAGGQGTRLGHNGPKGTYDIGLESGASLFQIQCDRLKRRSEACGHSIPWYIMTSRENHNDTVAFFEAHDYFGYNKEDILFFRQFMLPMIDFDGKIVMDSKATMKEGADGHGGIFRAMAACGIVEDMRKRGVEWIFVGGIDNVLVKLCDPTFVGFLAKNGYRLGGKSLIKRDAKEKTGVFCKRDGKPYVVEYTEISDEMAELRDAQGTFVYGDAHILCNMFRIDALEAMGNQGLPYHVAVKKAAYVGDNGEVITPDSPNAYKFEAFIFDAFSQYDEMGILRVERETEFAPVKNKTGEDSPETARDLYTTAETRNALD